MEEQNDIELDDIALSPGEALGIALQWLCSMRGGNNFFGRLLNGCRHVVEENLPYGAPAGVCVNADGKYQLIYSPSRFLELSPPLRILVLIHEAAHLALRHIERMLRFRIDSANDRKFRRLHEIMNVAADMAVNDVALRPHMTDVRNHFDTGYNDFIWPEERNYPQGKTYEEYFLLLLNDLEKHGFDPNFDPEEDLEKKLQQSAQNNQSGDGKDNSPGVVQGGKRPGDDLDDNYPGWFKNLLNKNSYTAIVWDTSYDAMTGAEMERAADNARRDAKRLVRQAVEQTEKCRGTIPAGAKSIIDELLGDPTIPWQEVFRGMLRSTISTKLDESTAYPNLAWSVCPDIEPYPGLQKNFTFNIMIGVDTSGSVSDEEFREFLKEILGICSVEQGIQARLISFDARLQREEILTEELTNTARASGYGRHGYGGTDFTPYLRYVNQKATDEDWIDGASRPDIAPGYPIDLAILFTDGLAPVGPPGGPIPEYLPNCPLIWALTPTGKEDDYMQPRVVRIGEI